MSDVPGALQRLVQAWVAAGKRQQPSISWQRDDWITTLPEHAAFLRGLPNELDRSSVRIACLAAVDSEVAAVRAFIAVMAWGFGTIGYGPFRTKRILTSTPNAGERLLVAARTLKASGVDDAYRALARESESRLKFLGPAFGTKFLHFCQPAGQTPRSLILDAFVAQGLQRFADTSLDPVPWAAPTYRTYLRLMHTWARALDIEAEDLEYCIFQVIADERGSQWGTDK